MAHTPAQQRRLDAMRAITERFNVPYLAQTMTYEQALGFAGEYAALAPLGRTDAWKDACAFVLAEAGEDVKTAVWACIQGTVYMGQAL